MDVTELQGWPLIVIGVLLLAGYAAHVLGQRAHVPRVTLLLLLGVLSGPSALDLFPTDASKWFGLVSEVALSMVGFMLGEAFLGGRLQRTGRMVLLVAVAESFCAALFVFAALLVVGTPLQLALLLAGIAPASAPAATMDVIRESGARGEVTDTVTTVVAIDDAIGIVVFAFCLVGAQAMGGEQISVAALTGGVWEIFGGMMLGGVLGLPMSFVTGRARPGELTLIETLGFVLSCGGLAVLLDVSYLLACITLGAVVANRARHHNRPFHAIRGISQPFLIVFFILAGLEFDWRQFSTLGVTGVAYVVARSLGKLVGGAGGARLGKASRVVQRHVGWCLLPQAGVALGLGLLAAQRFPEYGTGLLSLLLGTTFTFEVIGPIATRNALNSAGETGHHQQPPRHPPTA